MDKNQPGNAGDTGPVSQFRKIPRALEHLGLCTTAAEAACCNPGGCVLRPVLRHRRGAVQKPVQLERKPEHDNEYPARQEKKIRKKEAYDRLFCNIQNVYPLP